MKARITAVMTLGLMQSLLVAEAQQSDSLKPNSSYQCNDDMTLTVVRCAQQNGQEYCEFKLEQKGKLAFQGLAPKEKVAAAAKSCRTQAVQATSQFPRTMAEPGRSFNPPYLNEMPAVDFVKREIQGKDSTDTLARQIAVFNKLTSVISSFRLAANRYDLTQDEQKIAGKYSLAAYELEQGYKKTHTAAEADALTHLQGHYELMDPSLDREMRSKLFSTAFLQQRASADKTWLQALQAHKDEETRASQQAANGANSGSPFIRNDPGTLAARRCMELGGGELECVGKGFWTGLTDLVGLDAGSIGGVTSSEPAGVYLNAVFHQSGGLWLSFGQPGRATLNDCGKLVPVGLPYTISKQSNQLLITFKNDPSQFIVSMGSDRSLSGPGAVDVKGEIITGTRKIWMQHYQDNIPVAGGYWTWEPIYADKTERCTIGTLTIGPPAPQEKSQLMAGLTLMKNTMPVGPEGLRMSGRYLGQGGLALEFAADAVVLDCGAAHVKQPYTVENAPNQILINIKNGASPFTLALEPNGTLTGSGNAAIAGRVVTGATQNALAYAPKTASCAVGTLAPQGGPR